jgi:hypothetical protein
MKPHSKTGLAIAVLLLSCSKTYFAVYEAGPSLPTNISADRISTEVDAVVTDFGFRSYPDVTGAYFWSSLSGPIATQFASLDGADAHITISLSKDGSNIALRDLNNIHETNFVRILKQHIESDLAQSLSLRDIHFETRSIMDW